jgi:hypothetical protein
LNCAELTQSLAPPPGVGSETIHRGLRDELMSE